MQTRSRTQSLVLMGLSIALIASGSFIAVPFGPVFFTLQTMMLGLVICLLPPRYALGAVAGYLALGALGLPVFSGMRGGIGMFAGPTGGYLVGFLIAAAVVTFLRSCILKPATASEQNYRHALWFLPVVDVTSLVLFSLLYYVPGCVWFAYSTGVSLEASFITAILPFIIPDLLKAAAALVCVQPIRAVLSLGAPAVQRDHHPQ